MIFSFTKHDLSRDRIITFPVCIVIVTLLYHCNHCREAFVTIKAKFDRRWKECSILIDSDFVDEQGNEVWQ